MAKSKPYLELGLSEIEAYAVLAALRTTLEAEQSVDTVTTGFGEFASKLYRKSLTEVKDVLEAALTQDDEDQPAA